MSAPSTSDGNVPAVEKRVHRRNRSEASGPAVIGSNRRTSVTKMTSSGSVETETLAAEKLQRRRRRQCSILSLPAKRTDYSLEHDTDPSGLGITNRDLAPGTANRHDVTWELRSPEMAVSIRPQLLADSESEDVDSATPNSGTKLNTSQRIQRLMAKFDEDIKTRVGGDVKQRRHHHHHQKQAASFSEPRLAGKPRGWDMSPTEPAEDAQRPSTTEQNWAPSTSEVIVIKYEVPINDIGMALTVDPPAESIDGPEQERDLNRVTSMETEGEASFEFGPPTDFSYAERTVISEHAVAAHVVKPGKARVVKITTPRAASVHDPGYQYGAFRDSIMDQPIQTVVRRRSHRTRPKPQEPAERGHRRTHSRPDSIKREKRAARSLQPEDFIPRASLREAWPRDTKRHRSPPKSSTHRPIPPQSHAGGEDDDSRSSMVSVDGAEDNYLKAPPTALLFNMPNSPFLYHTPDQDEECPSLITDDGQDRRTEEIRRADSDQAPTPQSWEHKPGNYNISSGEAESSMADIRPSAPSAADGGITRRPTLNRHPALATRRGKPGPLNLEIKCEEFLGTAENPYQAGGWAECEGNWI